MDWKKQKLIDEFNNDFLLAVVDSFNRLSGDEEIGLNAFRRVLEQNMGNAVGYLFNNIDGLIRQCTPIVDTSDPNHWKLRVPSKIPLGLSNIERMYIKALLQSKYSVLFFDSEERVALLDLFADVPDLGLETLCVTVPAGSADQPISDEEIRNIRLLLTAIDGQREIRYSNRARNGRVYENCRGFPVKIEYTVIDDHFRLSLWSVDEERPVKVNIDTMYDLTLTETRWKHELTPLKMMEKRLMSEPIVMEMTDNRKTAERANLAFSMYNTVTERVDGGLWRVRLYCYSVDVENVVNSILSFGPNIRVVSPPAVVEKIKERLKHSFPVITE